MAVCCIPVSGGVVANVDAIPNKQLFGIDFGEGREFYGRVNAINSVSLQEYITPPFVVTEMVIDMASSPLQLRIYTTEPLDPVTEAAEVSRSAVAQVPFGSTVLDNSLSGYDKASRPVRDTLGGVAGSIPARKDYPVATHAKTIEYKLKSREDLTTLFFNVRDRWLRRSEIEQSEEFETTQTETTTDDSTGGTTAQPTESTSETRQNQQVNALNGMLFSFGE